MALVKIWIDLINLDRFDEFDTIRNRKYGSQSRTGFTFSLVEHKDQFQHHFGYASEKLSLKYNVYRSAYVIKI